MQEQAEQLNKVRDMEADQLSKACAVADNEAKERQSLLGKYRNAEHEVAGMKDHYNEEVSAKENIIRQMGKANSEAEMMKLRYEKEGAAKAEKLEVAKLKMQTRLFQVRKTKAKLQSSAMSTSPSPPPGGSWSLSTTSSRATCTR